MPIASRALIRPGPSAVTIAIASSSDGNDEQDVHDPHQDVVEPAAEVPGDGADDGADDDREADRDRSRSTSEIRAP